MNSYIKNVQLIGSGECDSNNTIGTLHVLGLILLCGLPFSSRSRCLRDFSLTSFYCTGRVTFGPYFYRGEPTSLSGLISYP